MEACRKISDTQYCSQSAKALACVYARATNRRPRGYRYCAYRAAQLKRRVRGATARTTIPDDMPDVVSGAPTSIATQNALTKTLSGSLCEWLVTSVRGSETIVRRAVTERESLLQTIVLLRAGDKDVSMWRRVSTLALTDTVTLKGDTHDQR